MEFVNYDSAKESAACGAGTHTDGKDIYNTYIIGDEKEEVNNGKN